MRNNEEWKELEETLRDNGEYEDGLKDWLESFWDNQDPARGDVTDEQAEEIEDRLTKEYQEEWEKYIDEEMEKERA